MGLSSEVFWGLDRHEFHALKYQWATERCLTLNLHANVDGVPFVPDDVFYEGTRAQRVAQIKADQEIAKMEAEIENFQLGQMKAFGRMNEDEAPAWARGKRRGR